MDNLFETLPLSEQLSCVDTEIIKKSQQLDDLNSKRKEILKEIEKKNSQFVELGTVTDGFYVGVDRNTDKIELLLKSHQNSRDYTTLVRSGITKPDALSIQGGMRYQNKLLRLKEEDISCLITFLENRFGKQLREKI